MSLGVLAAAAPVLVALVWRALVLHGLGGPNRLHSFVVTRLPEVDRLVQAPFDGVVARWQVQGAGGPIRLIVARGDVRPEGRSSLARVQGSAEQLVTNAGRQTFRTRLKIRKGDVVGLQLSVGAYASAPYSEGTWLELWIPPLALGRKRAEDSGSRDHELLYNAFIERDRDRDGFGDVTQDKCPKDPGQQEGCAAPPARSTKPWSQAQAVLTPNEGAATRVRAETLSYCIGPNHSITLSNGQDVAFEKMSSIKFVRSDDQFAPNGKADVLVRLVDGQGLRGSVGSGCDFFGYNNVGRFSIYPQRLERIDFQR